MPIGADAAERHDAALQWAVACWWWVSMALGSVLGPACASMMWKAQFARVSDRKSDIRLTGGSRSRVVL